MKVLSHYSDVPGQRFDGALVKGVTGRVVIGQADGETGFCMRLFTVAPGGFTPRHRHDWEHQILIHQGTGQVFTGDDWREVSSGSIIFIPGNQEHQLRNNSASDFVFACLIPKNAPEL